MNKIKNKIKVVAILMALLIISLPITLAEELNLNYDGVGNLISGDGFIRIYDGFNHLVQIKNDSGSVLEEFVWHPTEEKILIKKIYNSSNEVAQRIVYINDNTVKIKNSSGTFYEHYILQDGVIVVQRDTDGNKQAIHPDILGSANVVTDSSGNTLETNFVSPFGEPIIGGETTRFDYTGKEYDETTKLHDFKARQYKSEWGRMLQVDPIFFDVTKKFARERQIATYDPQLLNPYGYARNNPYKYVDRGGNFAFLAVVGYVAINVLVGAGVGAITNIAYQRAMTKSVNWANVREAAFIGGFVGLVSGSALASAGKSLATSTASSAALSALGEGIVSSLSIEALSDLDRTKDVIEELRKKEEEEKKVANIKKEFIIDEQGNEVIVIYPSNENSDNSGSSKNKMNYAERLLKHLRLVKESNRRERRCKKTC